MRRVNEHSRRFVDHYQMRIFEDNIQRHFLRPHRRLAGEVEFDLDKIVRPHLVTDILKPPVDFTFFALHDLAKIHLAQPAEAVEQKIV
jgi:hypothetical protein